MNELENVKPGDELLLSGFGTSDQIVQVNRVTGNYIFLANGRKFSKETGIQSPRSRWNDHILPLTPEKRAKLIARAQVDYLKSFQWERLNADTLNDIAQWMHEHGFDTIALQCKTRTSVQNT